MQDIALAVVVIIVLWFLILVTIIKFYTLYKIASFLLGPYLLWVSFAAVLNIAILVLN
jgi:tryptophan-rich sensory protein